MPPRQSHVRKIDNQFQAGVRTFVQAGTIGHLSVNVAPGVLDHWTDYWYPETISSGFVGRETDLERLRQALEVGGGVAGVQSVGGFGGIGKTKLAVAYANAYRDRYPDGRVFYDFQSYTAERAPHTADQALLQILPTVSERLSVVEVERLSAEGRISAWKECVAGRRLLMIWDNVKRVDQVKDLLLRDQPGCATIITSRDHIDLGDSTVPLTLDVLDSEAGRTLFRQIAGDGHPVHQVEALLDADLHIPVLIEFHARQIRVGERTAEEIIADLESAPFDPDTDPRQRLFDRFDGSYAHLNVDQKFALRVFGAHPGQFATAASLAAALGCGPTEANNLMDDLARAGFVRRHFHRSGEADPLLRAYSAHDSLRAYAAHQSRCEHDYFPAQDELAFYYLARLQEQTQNRRPWLDVELENIRDTALAGRKSHHGELCNAAGKYAFLLNRYNDAAAVYRHASKVFESTGNRIGYARALLGLAEVARARNEYQVAAEHFEGAGGIYQAIEDRTGYALSVQGLGHIARALGDYGAAATHFERAADLFEEDGNRDGHAHALWGLGDVARLRGEQGAAARHFEVAAEIYEDEDNQRGYAHSLQGLGHVARERREFEKAVSYYERAAEIYQALDHDLGFAFALQGLGDVALARGDHELAFQCYEPAAVIYRSVGNRTALAEVLLSLASMEEARGVISGAHEYLSDALALYDQIGLADQAAQVRLRLSEFGNAVSAEPQPVDAPPRSD